MKVIEKRIIVIDGQEYIIKTEDWSEHINNAIKNKIVKNKNEEIVEYIANY